VHWIDESEWLPWDGTPYNASQYSKSEFVDLICPGNTILGLREVFYETTRFADPVNPTKAEVDAWHAVAINHVRALVDYTGEDYEIEPDQCLHVRALWSEERKNTDIWDQRYPEGTCVGSTNPHCGATFIPAQEDQVPYLPQGVESCGLRSGSEGLFNAAKSNIPWSIRFIRPLCHTLGAEGFWGGHTGPWFRRKQFGFSWLDFDEDNANSNAGLVAKWGGSRAPHKHVNPSLSNALLQVEGEDPNPRFPGYECEQIIWMSGGSPDVTDCYNRVMANDEMGKRFVTWKNDGGCAGYPADMVECKVVGRAARLTWDLDPRSFSFDGLIVDPDEPLWTNRECNNIQWKTSAGDAAQCLQKLFAGPPGPFPDCGRRFMTWNAVNGGCACYDPDQECTNRQMDTTFRSGRMTYELVPDAAYDPPSPNLPTPLPVAPPTPPPVDPPTPPPVDPPTPPPVDPPTLPPVGCTQCTDEASPWMINNGKACATALGAIRKHCNESPHWAANEWCRQSCFEEGRGYDGDDCCVAPQPPCIACTDDPSPWMIRNGKACATSPNIIQEHCNPSNWWAIHEWCQQSCFDAGRGYSGPPCCNV